MEYLIKANKKLVINNCKWYTIIKKYSLNFSNGESGFNIGW